MDRQPELQTQRLLMRHWLETDRDPFAQLNADPAVMEHFPSMLSREESNAFVDRVEEAFDTNGFGLWAIELLGEAQFIGYVGLANATFDDPFTPAVEVGWRLAHAFWGRGFAIEAARAAVRFAFEVADLHEVVSFTVPANLRSVRVMDRLGMRRDPADDFDHPRLPEGHRLRRHVLCKLPIATWQTTRLGPPG